ncbi:MAG TPA: hypothetical protein VK988_07395 [Acidimicrobiales bacterium]|nr:hypothetical protein [Acidimicrobiales bacterium]
MDTGQIDSLMRALGEGQHGLVTREQLRSRGVSRQCVENRLRSAAWTPVSRRVLRLAGAPHSPEQQALAAVLDAGPGAVVSHQSAAALWRLPGFELEPLVLSGPRTGTKRKTALATLHHTPSACRRSTSPRNAGSP